MRPRLLAQVLTCAAISAGCSSSDPDATPDAAADIGSDAAADIGSDAAADIGSDAAADIDSDAAAPARPPGVALCYSATSSDHPATAAYWRAARARDRAARAGVITALQAAVRQHPDEEELALLLGLAHLWRLAEPLPAEASDPLLQLGSALGARAQLERAYELCPTDHRIAAWLGPVLVRLGRRMNDTAMVAEGMAVLDRGVASYPSFVLFSKLLVHADEPASSPAFREALTALDDNEAACGAASRDPACGNQPKVAHNVEGSMVFVGDVLAKAGRRDDALRAYRRAEAAPDHARWDYQALIADRIATIDDRVARLGNDDPADDPDVAWGADYQCSVCHAD